MPLASITEQMDFATAVSQFEKAILEGALAKTGGNKTAAAELLGLKRTTLIMKLRGLQYAGQLADGGGSLEAVQPAAPVGNRHAV